MKDMKENLSTLESLLDLSTAAAVLGCSVSTITRYCEDGTLTYITTHRGKRKVSRKIRPSTLHAFLVGNTVLPRIHPGVFPVVGPEGICVPPPITSAGADAQESPIVEDIMALLNESASGTTAAEEANVAS